ncbi:MAG: (2Fe-2S) ferredoxin domain-containing protein [Deinococcus sp.]
MPPRYFPTSGHLLLCGHTSCRERGSQKLYAGLWERLEAEHLAYHKSGGRVRLTASGCLGTGEWGPTLCVYRERAGQLEQGWYRGVDLPAALEIARAVQQETELPAEGRYGP